MPRSLQDIFKEVDEKYKNEQPSLSEPSYQPTGAKSLQAIFDKVDKKYAPPAPPAPPEQPSFWDRSVSAIQENLPKLGNLGQVVPSDYAPAVEAGRAFPQQETLDEWLAKNQVTDYKHPESFYDYDGAYQEGINRDANGHFPDTFKLPGHETFSVESKYYKPGMKAVKWEGGKAVPVTPEYPEIGVAPQKSLLENIFTDAWRLTKGSSDNQKTKAAVALSIQKHIPDYNNVPLNTIQGNLPAITKELGIRGVPTATELAGVGITLGLVASGIGAVEAAGVYGLIPLAKGIAGYAGLSEIENAIISKIKKEPYQPLAAKSINDLLPEDTADNIKTVIDITEFLAKAKALQFAGKKLPKIAEFATKQKIIEGKMPKKVYVSADEVASIFQTTENVLPEKVGLLKALGLTSNQWRNAVRKGIEIEVPAKNLSSIVDRPYWARLKSLFKIEPSKPIVTESSFGQPKQVFKMLPETSAVPVQQPVAPAPVVAPVLPIVPPAPIQVAQPAPIAPLRPEAIDKVSPAPIQPRGKGWVADRGSMPGEPYNIYKGKASLIERADDQGNVLYEAMTDKGQSLGVFPEESEAQKAAEFYVDKPTPLTDIWNKANKPVKPTTPQPAPVIPQTPTQVGVPEVVAPVITKVTPKVEKKDYIAILDTQDPRNKKFWLSSQIRKITPDQAKPLLEKGKIREVTEEDTAPKKFVDIVEPDGKTRRITWGQYLKERKAAKKPSITPTPTGQVSQPVELDVKTGLEKSKKLSTKQIYDKGVAEITADLNDAAKARLNEGIKGIDSDLDMAAGTGVSGPKEDGGSYGIKSLRPDDLKNTEATLGKNSVVKWGIARKRLEEGYKHPAYGEIPPDVEFLAETGQTEKARQILDNPKLAERISFPTESEYNYYKQITDLADDGEIKSNAPELEEAKGVVKRYEQVKAKLYPKTVKGEVESPKVEREEIPQTTTAPAEVAPLIAEAKKYKSAEEFIQAKADEGRNLLENKPAFPSLSEREKELSDLHYGINLYDSHGTIPKTIKKFTDIWNKANKPILKEASGAEYEAEQAKIKAKQERQAGLAKQQVKVEAKKQVAPLTEEKSPLFAGQASMQPKLPIIEKPTETVGGSAGSSAALAKGTSGTGYGIIETSEGGSRTRVTTTNPAKMVENLPNPIEFSALKDALRMVSPAHVSGETRQAGHVLRKGLAGLARQDVLVLEATKKAHNAFTWMNKQDSLDFIDNMENDRPQKNVKLQQFSDTLRKLLDDRRIAVQALGKGHLKSFYENYFPHIWKDPKGVKNVVGSMMGRKRLEGTKSFLKQRKIPTVKEGIKLGYELVSDNPVDIALLKMHEMDRYLMAQGMIKDLKAKELVKFVYSRSGMPEGYSRINDNLFAVFMPPEIIMKEAYDAIMVDNLMDVAKSLGTDVKRFVKLGGKRWGYAQDLGEGVIRTKFAGPESVLTHEIGHVIGYKYKIFDLFRRNKDTYQHTFKRGKRAGQTIEKPTKEAIAWRKKLDEQWRALADARFEGMKASPGYKSYVRNHKEKEAVLLEAFVNAKDKFKDTAPDLFKLFKNFLNENAELRPLLDIKPSLVLGQAEAKIKIPGFTTLGHFAAPSDVANLINNHLSPGLRSSQNKTIATGYGLARGAGNILNQVNLAFSLFHGLNVTTDMIASTIGLGLRKVMTKGQRLSGIRDIATAPLAPIETIWNGTRIKNAYRQQLDSIKDPKLKNMVETIVSAGGRDRIDVFYYNQQLKALNDTFSNFIKGDSLAKLSSIAKLPFNVFGSVLEVAAKPVMEWYVPTGKMGLFAKLAQHEMARVESGELAEENLVERLTQVWDSVDNRMGQLIYDNLFWNKILKDASMLVIRSVGWNLGSWREFGGAALDIATTQSRVERGDKIFSHKMAYTVGAVITYAILGSIIMYSLTGKPPQELKDYFFPKTGNKNADGSDERLSLPTYAKDWWAYFNQPVQTIKNKAHPLPFLITDLVRNKDFFNTQIRDPKDPMLNQMYDMAKYIKDESTSFSYKNFQKMQKNKQDTWKNAVISITGINVAPSYITKSPAQKLMTRYIVDRIPDITKTKEEFAKSEYRRALKSRIRKGEKIDRAEALQVLGSRSYKRLMKESRTPPFALSFKRLTHREALNVYAIANEEERKQSKNILRSKLNRAEKVTEDEDKLYWEIMGGKK